MSFNGVLARKVSGWFVLPSAAGLGIVATLIYQCLSMPMHQRLAEARSADDKYLCAIDEYSPRPWSTTPVPYLIFRILNSDDLQPVENESQTVWYEYLSRGRELDVSTLKVEWRADAVIISDRYGAASEWNPAEQWNANSNLAATQPVIPTTQKIR